MADKIHHWDFVDEDGCLHCNCGIGVIEPQPGSQPMPRETEIERLKRQLREGNARFTATVEAVVAERTAQPCPNCGWSVSDLPF